jgi:predicted dehydrogenase
MSRITRWGILGTGPMAAQFVRSLARLPEARAVAVGSRSAESAAQFARCTGIERSFGSYDALLADPEIDVVYIATVNVTHHALCLRALDAGKSVLCEKPFTLNAAQARDVVARARQRGLFCMEAMWTRFLPATLQLKNLIAGDAIGTPRMFSAQIGYPFVADPEGRQLNPALGGGALLDLGVYPVSLACFLFGLPEAAIGRATLAGTGVDESDAIVLQHAGGRLSVLAASVAMATPNEAVVMGTRGQIRLHEPFLRLQRLTIRTASSLASSAEVSGGRLACLKRSALVQTAYQRVGPLITSLLGRGTRRVVAPCEGEGYQYQAAEVMRCLREGQLESPIMPLDETIGILATLDELRRQWGVRFPAE